MNSMKYFLSLMIVLVLYSCGSKPQIIRKIIPVEEKGINIEKLSVSAKKDDVEITLRYMDKIELQKIAEENNPYVEGDTPLLTPFRITIRNNRNGKISFDLQNAVLLDGQGHQFQALTYESFKNLYPSTVYQQYEYSYVFERYTKQSHLTDDYYKRDKAAKTLFKGGKIYPKVTIEGILPFERLSGYVKDITLILSDIILYGEGTDTEKEDNDKILKKIEFQFKFNQKIVRLKD